MTSYAQSLYIVNKHYECHQELAGLEAEVNRLYLRTLLFESLATLGLVDIAYVYPHGLWPELDGVPGAKGHSYCSRYDGLLYARLNPLGAYCLGATDEPYQFTFEDRKVRFTVLPNHEVIYTSHTKLTLADTYSLTEIAKQMSDQVWKLDGKLILDYLDTKGSLEEIFRLLTANSTSGIPDNVRIFLEDLNRKAFSMEGIEKVCLVNFKDPAVAALLAHDPKTAKYCSPAGKNRLAVYPDDLSAFRNALKKMGYLFPKGDVKNGYR